MQIFSSSVLRWGTSQMRSTSFSRSYGKVSTSSRSFALSQSVSGFWSTFGSTGSSIAPSESRVSRSSWCFFSTAKSYWNSTCSWAMNKRVFSWFCWYAFSWSNWMWRRPLKMLGIAKTNSAFYRYFSILLCSLVRLCRLRQIASSTASSSSSSSLLISTSQGPHSKRKQTIPYPPRKRWKTNFCPSF